jgi:hypothetical protein
MRAARYLYARAGEDRKGGGDWGRGSLSPSRLYDTKGWGFLDRDA